MLNPTKAKHPFGVLFVLLLAFSLPSASFVVGCGGPQNAEKTTEASQEVTPEAGQEATPEAQAEATPEAQAEVTPEPQAEATPEPQAEPTPEAGQEATPEAQAEATPETQAEAMPEPTPETPTGISLQKDLIPIFQNNGCFGCHGGSGQFSMNANALHGSIVNVKSKRTASLTYVIPNDPANSYLLLKLKENPPSGGRMPQGGALAADEIQKVEDWIKQGAMDN